MPDNIDETKIQAQCKNGVLKVHLPKSKESTPELSKEIKIN
jgi:HSP20 family molecular chaperone IbpA